MVYKLETTQNGYVLIPEGPNKNFDVSDGYVVTDKTEIPAVLEEIEAATA